MGVRICSSAQLAMRLELWNLKLRGFAQESGQPLTTAWLCFMLKYGCQAPIAANAYVSGWSLLAFIFHSVNLDLLFCGYRIIYYMQLLS